MSYIKLTVVFVVSFILFLLSLMPINLLVNSVSLPKKLAYQGLSGTIWQGNVDSVQFGKLLFEDVHWQFEFSRLLTGNAAFDIKFGNPRNSQQLSGGGVVSTGLSGHQVQDFMFRMPASTIKPFLPIPVSAVNGRIILKADTFVYAAPICEQLSGELVWLQSGIEVNEVVSFGTISSTLLCEDNKLVAKFDGNNLLGIEGSAEIESARKYNFDGYVKPDASLPKMIHQSVGFLGKMDSKGRYKIKL